MSNNVTTETSYEKPDLSFLAIGPPKCGTTSLHWWLAWHPDICVPAVKETHFFDRYYTPEEGLAKYAKHFKACSPDSVIGEVCAGYFADPNAFPAVCEHYPDIKIIVTLRNPLKRMVSHINQAISTGHITVDTPIEEKVRRYPPILENTRYATHLSKYFDAYGRDNVLVLYNDDMLERPKEVIGRVYRFLGLSDEQLPPDEYLAFRYNSTGVRNTTYFRQVIKLWQRMRKNVLGRGILSLVRATGLKGEQLEHYFARLQRTKDVPEKIYTPTPEDEAYLRELVADEMRELATLLNDLPREWLSDGTKADTSV